MKTRKNVTCQTCFSYFKHIRLIIKCGFTWQSSQDSVCELFIRFKHFDTFLSDKTYFVYHLFYSTFKKNSCLARVKLYFFRKKIKVKKWNMFSSAYISQRMWYIYYYIKVTMWIYLFVEKTYSSYSSEYRKSKTSLKNGYKILHLFHVSQIKILTAFGNRSSFLLDTSFEKISMRYWYKWLKMT